MWGERAYNEQGVASRHAIERDGRHQRRPTEPKTHRGDRERRQTQDNEGMQVMFVLMRSSRKTTDLVPKAARWTNQ